MGGNNVILIATSTYSSFVKLFYIKEGMFMLIDLNMHQI